MMKVGRLPGLPHPVGSRHSQALHLLGGNGGRGAMEQPVEQQLERGARLRAEIDLAAVRHDESLPDAERNDVRLILQILLAEQPAALQDVLARIA